MTARPLVLALALSLVAAAPLAAQTRVADLTFRAGEVPRRLVGYGLVVGLDGTGDRSFGSTSHGAATVRSVVNLLRRFEIEVPAEHLRLRNVAAVLVTAEVSPYLRAGGRFETQVSAMGDATSLRGGVLWMTPLVADPDQPPVATAQGPLHVATDDERRTSRRANSARLPAGGVLEVDGPAPGAIAPRLVLREPDLSTARRIAAAINAALGDSVARVEDPGAIALRAPAGGGEATLALLADADTVVVRAPGAPRIVIDARAGSVVAGGDVAVGPAVITHRGITLRVGGAAGGPADGLVSLGAGASIQDVAAGLHAAGARGEDVLAIVDALRAAGALRAEVLVR